MPDTYRNIFVILIIISIYPAAGFSEKPLGLHKPLGKIGSTVKKQKLTNYL
jgi:hypothetical protein